VSLKLGADYLNRQRENFDGDIYAALAAYNGGPGNAAAWIQLAENDPDLFMEVIPYAETRNYIRRIYENFKIYRFIYSREQ
jgi:soluble lytic murein transglycosylase